MYYTILRNPFLLSKKYAIGGSNYERRGRKNLGQEKVKCQMSNVKSQKLDFFKLTNESYKFNIII